MKNGLIGLVFSAFVSLSCLNFSCVTSSNIPENEKQRLMQEVKSKDYIMGIEGLGAGGYTKHLTEKLCSELGMCGYSTAGNPEEHKKIILEAKKNGRKVYFVLHSLAFNAVKEFTGELEKQGIEIDCVYSMDLTIPDKIHGNIKKFVDIKGNVFYAFRGRELNKNDLENKDTLLEVKIIEADHLRLPEESFSYIRDELSSIR